MIHFDLPKQKSSIIKVLGVGGGGSNAVNYMYSENIEGVDFIICNTDAKALEQSRVSNKIQLGPHLTQGLGAGANPEVGKQATEESLEEIRRILEVNTKMAFICAGMGGGTGTGGAPIISRICRELGILTVGIVTTPFGFEGPKRLQQAEKGIRELEPYVDTLLVISNDKLRVQYGNLKMKEAFAKADNVLATAATCITDIINSRGHIIVDFADVCTVMKNGGVAILGSAAVEGEDRAQQAIEQALNSPLLNDSDIRGAKWILININSAEGEHECTMDELETINQHLRSQAGENSDVIVGMGYDDSLDKKIGITLIATGFDHKDPFGKQQAATKKQPVKEEKIVMVLGEPEAKPVAPQPVAKAEDVFAPRLSDPEAAPQSEEAPVVAEASGTFIWDLDPAPNEKISPEPRSAGSFLSKPARIYEEQAADSLPPALKPVAKSESVKAEEPKAPEKSEDDAMQLVIREEAPVVSNAQPITAFDINEDEEDQKRRAAERIQKLRNLSFNLNAADQSGEFDSVPAYVRRNMDLFGNTLSSVENFYSKYTVKPENDGKETRISTINTFLDGKKPD